MIEERKKVWLSITGEVTDKHSDADRMEFSTEGDLYDENGTSCLSYRETEVSGMEGTTTTVKVGDGKVSIIRLGAVNSLMEFEAGKRNMTLYQTPYGDFALGIRTKGVDVSYNEKKDPVQVKVNYAIEVEGITNSQNVLDIQIKH